MKENHRAKELLQVREFKSMDENSFASISRFPAVFNGIGPQRMKTIFSSRRTDWSLDLMAAFVSRREIRE